MDFRIIFDHMPDYVLIQTAGEATAIDHDRLMKELTSSPEWKVGTNQIVDHRELEVSSLSFDRMSAIQKVVSLYQDRLGKGKVAFLVRNQGIQGFVRMYETIGGKSAHGDIGVFETRKEAVEWLKKPSQSR